jgi:hypothetical protein
MNFQELNIDVWKGLNSSGTSTLGYKGIWLSTDDESESTLHIFKDEFGNFHLAIEVNENTDPKKVIDPKVNGLNVNLSSYLLGGSIRRSFLDIRCNINSYLPEFTKVTKDICAAILQDNKAPLVSVNEIINKWIVFWNNQNSKILSEEEQIGLLCELTLLKMIVATNPERVINGWVGPFKERHDFMFDKTSIEVKGTRSGSRTHTINGVDQLLPFPGKDLLFVSFLVSRSEESKAISLSFAINELYNKIQDYPVLMIRLNELLSNTGYSPLNSDEYEIFRFLVSDSQCYWVNNKFPFLTRHSISSPLIERISSVRYDITLEGISGTSIEQIRWDQILNN